MSISFWAKTVLLSGVISCLSFAGTTNVAAPAATTTNATTGAVGTANTAPTAQNATASAATVSGTSYRDRDSRFYGSFELRPSYTSLQGEVHSEDTIEAGYQLNKQMKVGYTQYFTTNLYSNTETRKGLELLADDAFFRFKGSDLLKSQDGLDTFSYQFRVYAPTYKPKRDAGYLTSIRNQFKIAHKFSNLVSVDFNVIPIFHAYNKGGSSLTGAPKANPVYEQMTVLNTDLHLTDKLTFTVPVIYSVTRYRSYEGATLSSRWGHNLWAWPELDYDVNSMNTVGIAYYTDNFLSPTADEFRPSDALKNGVFQVLWSVSL